MKNNFSLSKAREYFHIPVSGPDLDILRITNQEMKSIFDSVGASVLKLVKDQVDKSGTLFKAVIIVGRFGESCYLKEYMQDKLQSGIKVLQLPHSENYAVHGALKLGLSQVDEHG